MMSKIINLTLDDLNNITVHTTQSSLRRALAVCKYDVVSGTSSVPKLYYTEDNSIHALSSDISKFLLLKSFN